MYWNETKEVFHFEAQMQEPPIASGHGRRAADTWRSAENCNTLEDRLKGVRTSWGQWAPKRQAQNAQKNTIKVCVLCTLPSSSRTHDISNKSRWDVRTIPLRLKHTRLTHIWSTNFKCSLSAEDHRGIPAENRRKKAIKICVLCVAIVKSHARHL